MKDSRVNVIGKAIEVGKSYEEINRELIGKGMDKLYPRDPEDIVGIYCSVVPFECISAKEAYDRINKTCKAIIEETRYANAQDILDENNKPTYNSLHKEYERMHTDMSGHINTDTVKYTVYQAGELKRLIEETYECDDEQKIEALCKFLNDNKEYYSNIGIKKRYYMVRYLLKYLYKEIQDIASCVIKRETAIFRTDTDLSQSLKKKIDEKSSAIFSNAELQLEPEDKRDQKAVRNKLKDKELDLINLFAAIETEQSKINSFFVTNIDKVVDFYKLGDEKEKPAIDAIIKCHYLDKVYMDMIFDRCIDEDAAKAFIKNNADEIKELFREESGGGLIELIREGYKRETVENFEIMDFMIEIMSEGFSDGVDGILAEHNEGADAGYSEHEVRNRIWELRDEPANIIRIIVLRDNSRSGKFKREEPSDNEAVDKLTKKFISLTMNSKYLANGYYSRKRTKEEFVKGGKVLGNKDICMLVDALPNVDEVEKQEILEEFDFSWKYDEFIDINRKKLEKSIWR